MLLPIGFIGRGWEFAMAPPEKAQKIKDTRELCRRLERRLSGVRDEFQSVFDDYLRMKECAIQAAIDGAVIPQVGPSWRACQDKRNEVTAVEGALARTYKRLAHLTNTNPKQLISTTPVIRAVEDL